MSNSLSQIQDEIKKFSKNDCKIIAVSKLQPIEKIQNLFNQGQIDFAENYVQEAVDKQKQLSHLPICWHFIGHLQKNKVKFVVGKFELIHTVDSLSLAEKINLQASQVNVIQKILIQVNISKEISKNGVELENLSTLISQIKKLDHVDLRGMMTMPPLFQNPEEARPFFRQLAQLCRQHQLPEISMGTSSDYQIAIQEGATLVRLGTILFGERIRK